MARLRQNWLFSSLILSFFFFQLGLALVFSPVPPPDLNPGHLRARGGLEHIDEDLTPLDLLSRDSFFWSGTQNGHLSLANFTVDLPGDDETIISMEKFRHMLKSVDCTADTMTLGFKGDPSFGYIKNAWKWLNDADPRKLVVVAGAGACGWNDARFPFSAASVVFDEVANTAKLIGKALTWKDFQNYELTVGKYQPASTSSDLSGRDFDKTLSLDFNHALPFNKWTFPIDDISVIWDCTTCGTTGSFDFGFHIKTEWAIPKEASFTLQPNGVGLNIAPKIGISGNLTGDISDEKEIATIPIGGISIPGGILDVGPEIVFSIGYSIGPVMGQATISSGVEVTLDDSAELEIVLTDPDVSSSGWTPNVKTLPVTVDAKLSAGVSVYLKAAVQLSAEAVGQGFQAGVNLKPAVGGTLSVEESSDGVCDGEEGIFGVKITPSLGISLNADVAKSSEPDDPLVQAQIFNYLAPLPSACFAFGPDGTTTGGSGDPAPSSSGSIPSSTPVAPVPTNPPPISTPVIPPTTLSTSTYTYDPPSLPSSSTPLPSVYARRRHFPMKFN